MMSFPEPTQWNGDPEPEREWDRDDYDVEAEREIMREIEERNSTWEQERRLDWFVSFGLLVLLLSGWVFTKIRMVWQ